MEQEGQVSVRNAGALTFTEHLRTEDMRELGEASFRRGETAKG